jgi:hypothetical protein
MTEAASQAQEHFMAAEREHEATELKARLAAAQARKVAAQASQRSELDTLREQVEAEEREARNAEAIADAERKLGRRGVYFDVVTVPDGRIVVLKRPHPAAYKAFSELDKPTVDATHELVRPCVEFPGKGEFDTIIDEQFPAVLDACGIKVLGLAGMRRVELGKK